MQGYRVTHYGEVHSSLPLAAGGQAGKPAATNKKQEYAGILNPIGIISVPE